MLYTSGDTSWIMSGNSASSTLSNDSSNAINFTIFSIKCTLSDGSVQDVTEKLKNYGAHALLFLNIKSYSGGTRPWKQRAGVQSAGDGLVEVVAMDNVDLALLNLGGTGESIW